MMNDQPRRSPIKPVLLVPIVAVALFALGFVVLALQQSAQQEDGATQITEKPDSLPADPTLPDTAAATETPAPPETEVADVAPAPPRTLEVIGTVPLRGDPLSDQIVVFFDAPLAAVDVASFEPLVLDPPITGTFRAGDRFIAFKPDRTLDEWTTTARVHPDLRGADGSVPSADWAQAFSSTPFKPVAIEQASESTAGITLSIRFNAGVNAGDVLAHASAIGANGDALDIQSQNTDDPRAINLIINGADNWPATLTLQAGLTDATGALAQADDTVFTFPEVRALRVDDVYWSSTDRQQPVLAIQFNEAVAPDQLQAALAVSPLGSDATLAFTINGTEASTEHFVAVQPETPLEPEQGLHVAIANDLSGEFGGVLGEAVQRDLVIRSEPFALTDTWWNYRDRDGLALQLSFSDGVSAQALRDHLEVLPEIGNLRVEQSYGSAVYVLGDWDSERNYEIRIAAGMPRPDGGTLDQPIATRVRSEEVPRYLGFNQPGKYYFPRVDEAAVTVESRNVRTADVKLHRMFPSNVAVALAYINNGEGGQAFANAWSEELKSESIRLGFEPDRLAETPIVLSNLLPDQRKGLFNVEVSDDKWTYASKLVLMTNIGLLAHWQGDALVLFAHDLYSLAPHDGARVTVYSDKNQVLGQTTTNEQGVAQLSGFDKALGNPAVAVVERGDDYTFVELDPRGDTIAEVTPSTPLYDAERYDAFVYADRDLYRPGETAHVRWLVRHHYGDAVPAVPLKFIVTKPNGRVLLERAVTLSELGSGGAEVETRHDYPTGTYTARLEVPGSKTPAGSYDFKVEEFVPNRLRTNVTVAEPFWVAGQAYTLGLQAEHLAGGAAADRRCEGRLVFRGVASQMTGWEGFRFGNDAPYEANPIELGDARTDAEGLASFELPATLNAPNTQPLTVLAVGRTFELGGRGVFGSASTTWFPSDTCLGVSIARGPGGELQVDTAAVAPSGEPAALSEVSVTLEKRVWHYNVRRFYSHHEPHWSETFEPVETKTVALTDGRGNTTFDVGRYGEYRVRVHSDATPQYSTQAFYSAWNRIEIVDESRPSLIEVTMDRDEYVPGDEAIVRIKSPFDGEAFIVLQGESLINATRVPVENGNAEYRFTVAREQFPNIWAGVTVVHAIDDERAQVYPFESFAMTAVSVNDAPRKLQIAFGEIPDVIKPGTSMPVSVTVTNADGNPAAGEVTIAAVDEGIHSITDYKTPDPYAWVARLRAPDHRRAHYYDKVAYDFSHPSEPGDLDALLGKRAASISDNWIKPLALWSGPLTTDDAGHATATFDLPEFSGELRLVAVAATDHALGAAEMRTKVRRDQEMRVSVPRFLLPEDEAEGRVLLMNRGDQMARATIEWEATGGLAPLSGRAEIFVNPNSEQVANVPLKAGDKAADGRVTYRTRITDEAGNELDAYEQSFEIPVRSPAAYQSSHELIRLAPGDGQVIRNTGFLEDDRAELSLFVSAQPQLQLADAIDYVVGYPHGCIEQTTSRLMPMYLLRKHSALTDKALDKTEKLDIYLQAGIARLFAMQTHSGGLAMWPGGSQPYPYGSVYALHFLNLIANGREYALPEESMNALRGYVRGLLEDDSDGSYGGAFQRAYATYALTVGGDQDAALQIGRFDAERVPSAGRYLLASALLRSTGDAERARRYLDTMPAVDWAERERGGTLNSGIRNSAIELLSLTELKGDPDDMQQRANALIAYLRDNRYGNTHETAFIIAALSGYLDLMATNADVAAAEIERSGETARIEGLETYTYAMEGAGAEYHVRNTGDADIYVSVTRRGVPETVSAEPQSNGIAVARALYTNDGNAHEGAAFGQAEAFVIALTIDCEYGIENVVLVDKLPAGFEIENPRLAADAMPDKGLSNSVIPSSTDVRDDRIVLAFDKLNKGRHTYHYIVRAVTPGRYDYPPAQAECMYDASVYGRSAAQTVTVQAG